MIGTFAMSLLAATQAVPFAWECRFEGNGDAAFQMQGQIEYSEDFLGRQIEGMRITRDESGRYAGSFSIPPYFAKPKPDTFWLVFNARKNEGLLLDFTSRDGRGSAQLIRGDFKNPAAKGDCTVKDELQ